jgi:hypothetical protein
MIMCDFCGDWYHYDCVGVSDIIAKSIDTYKCEICISKNCQELIYEEGIKVMYKIVCIIIIICKDNPSKRTIALVGENIVSRAI